VKRQKLLLGCLLFCGGVVGSPGVTRALLVDLGSAGGFAVLGASTVTNTGPTSLSGGLGVSPGTAITGFFGTVENDGPGVFQGAAHQGNAFAQEAQADALSAYNLLVALPVTQTLTGQGLGGLTLVPGVYKFDTSAQLTGFLVLDGIGDYVFQIGTTLTTASSSRVEFINGADPFNHVFWLVGSSATLGSGTDFGGTIIADQSVDLITGASVDGRVIALNAAVTLDNNAISIPEPAWLVSFAACGLAMTRRRRTPLAACAS
jgi:hypothetical protein